MKEIEPERGVALDVIPGVKRIVARNPGSMTYYGTNTYLIEDETGGLTVLDPGPDRPDHVDDIIRESRGRIRRILISHTHHDHIGAVPALRRATGVPTHGWRASATPSFVPDIALGDGTMVAGLTAVFTPGHAADHLCFAWRDGVLFSGDHVMGWSSTIVSPPLGRMADYIASLRRLLSRGDSLYLSGHGPTLHDPRRYVQNLLAHRLRREASIQVAVAREPSTTADLMERLYHKTDPLLRRAAERNVLAHLYKLEEEGEVARDGDLWRTSSRGP